MRRQLADCEQLAKARGWRSSSATSTRASAPTAAKPRRARLRGLDYAFVRAREAVGSRGSATVIVVPTPTFESTKMRPSLCEMMP